MQDSCCLLNDPLEQCAAGLSTETELKMLKGAFFPSLLCALSTNLYMEEKNSFSKVAGAQGEAAGGVQPWCSHPAAHFCVFMSLREHLSGSSVTPIDKVLTSR